MRASSRMISRQASWPRRHSGPSLSVAASVIAATISGSFSWGAFFRKLHPRARNANLILGGSENSGRGIMTEKTREKIHKNDDEWKKQLTPNQYFVTRQQGTEPPFTGEYENTETAGTYKCVCCGQPLFRSDTKYHSGSGWPSFSAPADKEAVAAE